MLVITAITGAGLCFAPQAWAIRRLGSPCKHTPWTSKMSQNDQKMKEHVVAH